MEAICYDSRSFADPFCGSGTVLFEANERGCAAWGIEVNPAAWHLGSIAEFAALSLPEKKSLQMYLHLAISTLSTQSDGLFESVTTPEEYLEKYLDQSNCEVEAKALAAAIILGMGNNETLNTCALQKGFFGISSVINRVTKLDADAKCILGDARSTGLPSESVEAVITSPPYINVFNYHQNYRPAVELLGWKPLQAAKVEIGANRKFRQNRFLTVVQYCIDMQQALAEMSRFMKTGAPLIIILGRTSNVLGCSFENGAIIKKLLENGLGFEKIQQAERVFTSRFGERIFEDIIVAERMAHFDPNISVARNVGREALCRAQTEVSDENRLMLLKAIEASEIVGPSSCLEIDIPAHFNFDERKKKNASHSNYRARR
jgi:hypothetical protein